MSDFEKLRALVDLAWRNGYEYLRDEGIPFAVSSFSGCSEEQILFDHEFVKSLAKSKYGDDWNSEYWEAPRNGKNLDQYGPYKFAGDHGTYDPPRMCRPWEHQLVMLALSTDRIGYLYREFCGE